MGVSMSDRIVTCIVVGLTLVHQNNNSERHKESYKMVSPKTVHLWIIGCLSLVLSFCIGCGGSSPSAPSTPSVPIALSISPSGVGLDHATLFTFTATGGTNITQYAWNFGDGTTTSGTPSAVGHVYDQSGAFNAQVQATSQSGVNTTATLNGVTVKPVTGTWDLTVVPSASYPWLYCTRFTAVLTQNGNQISGTITPTTCSRTRNNDNDLIMVTTHITIPSICLVSNPRHAVFGSESYGAPYADNNDFYFSVELGSDLNTMTGTADIHYSSVTGVRR